MNIFVLDNDARLAAKYQCDKHVVKMVLETAQLLCSAHDNAPYKKTHYNHPCAVWTRASMSNYEWLVWHGICLAEEYEARFDRTHKSKEVIMWCDTNKPNVLDFGQTPFAQAMPDKYKHEDAVTAYRNYYVGEKASIAQWRYCDTPVWFTQGLRNNGQLSGS